MADHGRIIGPLINLQHLIAQSTAFQEWCGFDDDLDPVASAEGRIFFQEPSPLQPGDESIGGVQLSAGRPRVVIDWFTPEQGYGGMPQMISRLGVEAFGERGKLFMGIEADSTDDDHVISLVAFSQKLEGVVDDMLGLAGRDVGAQQYLSITAIELHARPHRSLREQRQTIGDFWKALLVVSWEGGG